MKAFFQLIDRRDGSRSDALGCTREEYAQAISSAVPPEAAAHFYVLVLVDDVSQGEWNFSTAPMMTAQTFMDRFSTKLEVVNG